MAEPTKRRCAIYTRKSTEEGLDQEFNSLDAQREACRAYVLSQMHEGWELDEAIYDDGGYSGGNVERPALQQLLSRVREGDIHIIIVYKVDRLTRSLADFAKIVEIMDDAGASFVSVTQSFNTSTSMGRLTLNVLLSFAQFEREVTSERIRDKIAASKKKGMFMGGPVPLGYRLEDRKLHIDQEEAKSVITIFETYLECGTMIDALTKLEQLGVKTKQRTYKTGQTVGGVPFTRGGLQHLLKNPVYFGEIAHKEKRWPGEHEAIISRELWEKVQAQLVSNDHDGRKGPRARAPSLLAGLVFDADGKPLIPNHATKGKKRYRYYVTKSGDKGQSKLRVPAHDLEEALIGKLSEFLTDTKQLGAYFEVEVLDGVIENARLLADRLGALTSDKRQAVLRDLIKQVTVRDDAIAISLTGYMQLGQPVAPIELEVPAVKVRSGGQTKLIVEPEGKGPIVDDGLVKLVAEAFVTREEIVAGRSIDEIAEERGQTRQWIGKLLKLGWLPPKLVQDILDGNQPQMLTGRKLCLTNAPMDRWGFADQI